MFTQPEQHWCNNFLNQSFLAAEMAKNHKNIPGGVYAFHHWWGFCPKYLLIRLKYLVINLTQSWDLVQVVTVSAEDKVRQYLLQTPTPYESSV